MEKIELTTQQKQDILKLKKTMFQGAALNSLKFGTMFFLTNIFVFTLDKWLVNSRGFVVAGVALNWIFLLRVYSNMNTDLAKKVREDLKKIVDSK